MNTNTPENQRDPMFRDIKTKSPEPAKKGILDRSIRATDGDFLLVIDMQNDFITGSLGSKDAEVVLPRVETLVDAFPGMILYTKDTHRHNYLFTQEGKNLPVRHCIYNTSGWCVPDTLNDILVQNNACEILKETFGVLEFSQMETQIGHGAYQNARIYVCGLCTDICVVSNALILRSKFPEHEIYCVSDCCAGTTPEKHLSALQVMESCQVKTVHSSNVLLGEDNEISGGVE